MTREACGERPDGHLDLLMFTSDPSTAQLAESAGVDGLLVDWEVRGKAERQAGCDMQIGADTLDDLRGLVACTKLPVTVRINPVGPGFEEEVDTAIENGARQLMLPMAANADEVSVFLEAVAGRARTIVQVETQGLFEALDELNELGWGSAYIGLHDLMLSRGAKSMWESVLDGSVEKIFEILGGRKVGFAGATVIGGGHPIPFPLLLHELARLGASLTFLRRSFHREIKGRDMIAEIGLIRSAWAASLARNSDAVERDRERLMRHLQGLVEH